MDTRQYLTAERLWALLIDWMLVSFMSSIVTKLPIPNVSTPFASWSEYGLIGIAIAVIYSGIMEGSRGATIGKEVLKLRVVNLNGNHISYATSFTRAICKFIPLGWLLMLFDENRALHDYIAKTRVIQV